jgi:hypothetical protein
VRAKGIHISSGAFALLGVFIIWECRNLPYWSEFGPGPGFLPLWLGICLALFSAGLFIRSIAAPESGKPGPPFFAAWKDSRRAWLVILGYIAMGVLIRWLGFYPLCALFVIFTVKVVERRSWGAALAIGVVVTVAFYVVFDLFIKSDMPRAVLW